MSKIDTQGMSGESVEGCTDNVYPHDENGEPILPPGEFKELPIFDEKERKELKEIMIEAMREYNSYPKYPPYRLDELQE
mgnify:FL=1|tara:strand:- start:595 stop:831 length:237 start_codon:yes stop_codon:yes gene_type:complete